MNSAGAIALFLILVGIVAPSLFAISRIRNQKFQERGHFILSFFPWVHTLLSSAVATYVRVGFGAWPRSCIDNPDLPMINGLVMALILGLLFVEFVVSPVWLGWLILR